MLTINSRRDEKSQINKTCGVRDQLTGKDRFGMIWDVRRKSLFKNVMSTGKRHNDNSP